MYFTRVRLQGLQNVNLPVQGASATDPYIFKGADGLGPPENENIIEHTKEMGGLYLGTTTALRQLVLRVGLNPNMVVNQTAEQMRTVLYGLLTPGTGPRITVQLMNGALIAARTYGYVKRIEIVPFSKEPEVQITIDCTQSFFEANADVSVLTGLSKSAPVIENLGTAPAGFRFELTFTSNVSTNPKRFYMENPATGEFLDIWYPFLTGNKLIVDTRPGSRGITIVRQTGSPLEISGLSKMVSGSSWLMLQGGINTFGINPTNFNWVSFVYRPQFWGV
jgi:hypothetical protein